MGWDSKGNGLVELYMRLWRKGVISFVRLRLRVFSGNIVKGGGRISLEFGGEIDVILDKRVSGNNERVWF